MKERRCSEERNISVSQGNLRISPGCCRKIYIPRDYTLGSGIKFSHKLPVELEGKIDKEKFESTINTLNLLYAEAERATCSTYTEGTDCCPNLFQMFIDICAGCLACLSANIILYFSETQYEKCLKKVSRFVHDQNEAVWTRRGLLLTDPVERGLRVVEVTLLTEPLQPQHQLTV